MGPSRVDGSRRCGIDGVVPLAVDTAATSPLMGVSWLGDLSRKTPSVRGGEGAWTAGSSGTCSAALVGGDARRLKNKAAR
jgi:hypothetical protein